MLLLHDMTSEVFDIISKSIPTNTKIISKEMKNIHACIGCFSCWLKTPGICCISDDYTLMPKYIIENDIFIIISQITYGCYSSYIKNVIERSIGVLLPFMHKVNNETHHPARYKKKMPKLIFIGYGKNIPVDEKQTFKDICKGNAINFGAKNNYECYISDSINDINKIINSISGGRI